MRILTLFALSALSLGACGSGSNPASPDGAVDPDSNLDPTGLTVAEPSVTMIRGTTFQLAATATFPDGPTADVTSLATWSTSAQSIATVSNTGFVTAIAAGPATITATFKGLSAESHITVTDPTLAVADRSNAGIDFFPSSADGTVTAIRSIRGNATLLVAPTALAVANDEIYVADSGSFAISVFPLAGSGNIAPTRRIAGASTNLVAPGTIAVAGGEIFVGTGNRILVFPATGTGDISPTRVMGPDSELQSPSGIAISGTEIFAAANTAPDNVVVYPTTTSGSTAPARQLIGAQTKLLQVLGITIADGEILVANGFDNASSTPPSVTSYPIDGNGNVPPTRTLELGILTGPGDLVVSGVELFITNTSDDSVLVYPVSSNGLVSPSRTIRATVMQSPDGIVAF